MALGKPPLPWTATSSSSTRQWAPLHFSPLTSSFNANYSKFNGESTGKKVINEFRWNNKIHSAPVTPVSPLSPVQNGWNTNKMFSSRENLTVDPHLELIIETSSAHRSPSSSSVTPRKGYYSLNSVAFVQHENFNVVVLWHVYFFICCLYLCSANRRLSTRYHSLPLCHLGLLIPVSCKKFILQFSRQSCQFIVCYLPCDNTYIHPSIHTSSDNTYIQI